MEFDIYTMIYKFEKNKINNNGSNGDEFDKPNIKICGHEFVRNNKNKAKLIINNKKYHLTEFIDIINEDDDIKKIKIILNKYIFNKNCMFKNCESLSGISINNNSDYEQIEDNSIFERNNDFNLEDITLNVADTELYKDQYYYSFISDVTCSDFGDYYNATSFIGNYYKEIPDSNTYNAFDRMFYKCDTLTHFSGLSHLFSQRIFSLSQMFYNCKSLSSLPNISKWNTDNVTDMSFLFYNCSSLYSLPDISNWNTDNVINLNSMFLNCISLKSLPDISRWNTNNVKNMSKLFFNCSALNLLPDISRWDTSNVLDMSYMFFKCLSLWSLPDI